MFGHIYYFFGLILFLLNLGHLMRFSKIQKTKSWIDSFFKVTQRKPNKDEIKQDDYQQLNSFQQIFAMNFLWIFFGLITKSWKFFLLLLLINFILNYLVQWTKDYKKINFGIEFIKFFITTFCLGFIVINHFHLHIDVFQYFWGK